MSPNTSKCVRVCYIDHQCVNYRILNGLLRFLRDSLQCFHRRLGDELQRIAQTHHWRVVVTVALIQQHGFRSWLNWGHAHWYVALLNESPVECPSWTMMLWATTLALALLSSSKSNILTLDLVANDKGASSTNFIAASNNSRTAYGACVYIRSSNCQKSKGKPKWHFHMIRLSCRTVSKLTIDLTEGYNCILWYEIVIMRNLERQSMLTTSWQCH